MVFKRYQERMLIRVLGLFLALALASYLLIKGEYPYLVFWLLVVGLLLVDFYNFHRKAQEDGAWVREAALAHAQKRNGRLAAE